MTCVAVAPYFGTAVKEVTTTVNTLLTLLCRPNGSEPMDIQWSLPGVQWTLRRPFTLQPGLGPRSAGLGWARLGLGAG